ncbi:hypothetical protein [Oceanospirillum sediminis]|uniref:Uncharacterized protein n=1 Tax=Oceanospirillum sediminis TaxID=2760088 RepID=A0A839IS30_9GAMM|nr:hypothetical protein [Oceanospirillum sediminis]MBB1487778.1 hypothetical protein [Oceanospirillum sediminis]
MRTRSTSLFSSGRYFRKARLALAMSAALFVSSFSSVAIGATTTTDTEFLSVPMQPLNGQGNYLYQAFTVTSQTGFDFLYAADYATQAVIIAKSDLANFINGSSVSYFVGFDGDYGIKSATLEAGEYVIAVRNTTNSENTFSLELDYANLQLAGYEYDSTPVAEARSMEAGAGLIQPFTITDGYKYHIDGLNTGVKSYVIPASEIEKFRNNEDFNFYTSYSSNFANGEQPGAMTIDLPAGDYALVLRNSSATTKSLVYRFHTFKQVTEDNGDGTDVGTETDTDTDSKAAIDLVFDDIEEIYSQFFPVSTRNGSLTEGEYYYRQYTLDDGQQTYMLEWDGGLWYNVDSNGWQLWGPIANWGK